MESTSLPLPSPLELTLSPHCAWLNNYHTSSAEETQRIELSEIPTLMNATLVDCDPAVKVVSAKSLGVEERHLVFCFE